MDLRAGVGSSRDRNPVKAGREAVDAAREAAGEGAADLVLVYATAAYDQELLVATIHEATGRAPMIGGSVEGTISRDGSREEARAVQVTVIRSRDVRFKVATATGLGPGSRDAGASVGAQIFADAGRDPVALLTLADGLTMDFPAFAAGLGDALDVERPLPILGGLASDSWGFRETFQYADGRVLRDAVVAALIRGDARLAYASTHACTPIEAARTITRARGDTIYEIDGRRAVSVVADYVDVDELDAFQKFVSNFAFAFEMPPSADAAPGPDGRYLVQNAFVRGDEEGSVRVGTEVKAGTRIWLVRHDHERVAEGLDGMVARLRDQLRGRVPRLALHFDCAARGKVGFGQETTDALARRLREGLAGGAAEAVPWAGARGYGQLAPAGRANRLHAYTAVVGCLY